MGALSIGEDEWGQPVELTNPLRSMHVLGVPNMGKSTLLGQLAVWYQQAGCGVVVLDIKDGKLAADVVTRARLPLEQYLYFAPGQTFEQGYSWTLNPLDGNPAEVLDNVLDMLSRVGQLQSSFTQLKEHLSMAIRLAVRQPSPTTLHDVADILTSQATRLRFLDAGINLPKRVREHWESFNAQATQKGFVSNRQRDSVSSTIVRLDDWLVDEPLASLLAGTHSSLRLDEALDAGKLIVCDLVTDMPSGQVIEAGNLVMAMLLNAALLRDPHADKRPWVVVADEFDLLAGDFFRHSLDKLRAAGLRIVAAHQNLSQVSPGLATSLTSVPLKVYFRPSPLDVPMLSRLYVGTSGLWGKLGKYEAAVLEEDVEIEDIPWLPTEENGWQVAETADWPDPADMVRLNRLSGMMLGDPYTRPLGFATKEADDHPDPTIQTPPQTAEPQPEREAIPAEPDPPRKRRARRPGQMRLLDAVTAGENVLLGRGNERREKE